jgi:CHAT domain-containing protein
VVPDRSLFSIPWGALPWKESYLVEGREIAIEPSASVFVRLTEVAPRSEETSALIVANPLFYRDEEAAGEFDETVRGSNAFVFRPLPEAEQEAEEVSTLFDASLLLVGDQAGEPTVRSEIGQRNVIHFGTHARIVPDQPLASSLLLAGGGWTLADSQLEPVSVEDGVLTGYEVLGLQLKPQTLVTLAACESVGKERREGEGVVGLARAFFEAGAGTVVASLWPVEDRATRELMVRFYRELTAGKVTTARALAAAQTAMAKGEAGETRKHPFYWAGFVLIGDGR